MTFGETFQRTFLDVFRRTHLTLRTLSEDCRTKNRKYWETNLRHSCEQKTMIAESWATPQRKPGEQTQMTVEQACKQPIQTGTMCTREPQETGGKMCRNSWAKMVCAPRDWEIKVENSWGQPSKEPFQKREPFASKKLHKTNIPKCVCVCVVSEKNSSSNWNCRWATHIAAPNAHATGIPQIIKYPNIVRAFWYADVGRFFSHFLTIY